MKRLTVVCFFATTIIATACSIEPSPEKARAELVKLKIAYNVDTFVERAGSNDPVAVKLFLAAGMNPNANNSIGTTALYEATKNNDLATVKVLFDNEAKINRENVYERNLEKIAIDAGNTQMTSLLLERLIVQTPYEKGRYLHEAFEYACHAGQEMIAKALFPKLQRAVNEHDLADSIKLSIHAASWAGSVGLVEFLLDHGAPVNAKDSMGATPIFNAAIQGHLEVARLLVKRGADLHIKNINGESAASLANERGHPDVSRLILDAM